MPGAGRQTPEIQRQIRELLEAGFDPTTIHRRLKVGRSSIYRMKRCLQRHGTTYISVAIELVRLGKAFVKAHINAVPKELNKKNGRPKVLAAEQELEVCEWLRKPDNRERYLDDLVWLIHDRFSIVCSTTTMSKMKRKWLRVIEYEETGRPLDEATRTSLLETHPDLPILRIEAAMPVEESVEQDGGEMALPDEASAPTQPPAPMIQPDLQETPMPTGQNVFSMHTSANGTQHLREVFHADDVHAGAERA